MRYFGAIGHPPERFYRAAVTAFVDPCEAHMIALRPLWKRLTKEERKILDVSHLGEPETKEDIRALCTRIIHAYTARRSWEMTPIFVRHVRQAQLRTVHS